MIQKKCDQCEKIIEGYTEKQVDYMMKQHKLAKHNQEEENESNYKYNNEQ